MYAKYVMYMEIPHSPTRSDYDDCGAEEGFRIVVSDRLSRRKDEVADISASSISMEGSDEGINGEGLPISSGGPHEEGSDPRRGGRPTSGSRNGL